MRTNYIVIQMVRPMRTNYIIIQMVRPMRTQLHRYSDGLANEDSITSLFRWSGQWGSITSLFRWSGQWGSITSLFRWSGQWGLITSLFRWSGQWGLITSLFRWSGQWGLNYIVIQMVRPMRTQLHRYSDGPANEDSITSLFRWSGQCCVDITLCNLWFDHDGPQDHLPSDLDGSAHFLLVTDHRAIGYCDPCFSNMCCNWHLHCIKACCQIILFYI